MAAIGFGIILRAILVFDTAFEVKGSAVINADAGTVWTWMTDDKNRSRWQTEIIDFVRLTGQTQDVGATRLVFWKRDLKRWQATERTLGAVPGRALNLMQQSDIDKRWLTLSLEVISDCQTRLSIDEIIEPSSFSDRFWFFNARTGHETRIQTSFDALNTWMETTVPACAPNDVFPAND